MRVWKASGADPRCTLSCTKATVALSYAAFHTPCFTNRRRLRSRSALYFILLATRTNGASPFPEGSCGGTHDSPSALALDVAVQPAPTNRHRYEEDRGRFAAS